MMNLLVQEITDNNQTVLGSLSGDVVTLGREVESAIVVARDGVSRDHGRFIRSKQSWLYADLGSTNGSWLNGKRLSPDKYQVVRAGDMIQVADAMLRLKRAEHSVGNSREAASLVVLKAGVLVDEFPVPDIGQALVLGGGFGDLPLSNYSDNSPLATVVSERSDLVFRVLNVSAAALLNVNGSVPSGDIYLKHNDLIMIADYLIVVSKPPQSEATNEREDLQIAAQRMRNLAFGKDLKPMSKQEMESADLVATPQESSPETPEQIEKFALIEDGIILVLGIVLLGALLGIGAWWFINR